MRNSCTLMSQRGKYFIPRPANTSSHLISVKTRLRSSLLFAFKLETVQRSRKHPRTQHKSMSSPARGLCWGSCSGQSQTPSNGAWKKQLEPGLCQAGSGSSLSDLREEQGREGNLGSLLVCIWQILWELWRRGCTSMAVPAALQQSHGPCLCCFGRLRDAGWKSCSSFCFVFFFFSLKGKPIVLRERQGEPPPSLWTEKPCWHSVLKQHFLRVKNRKRFSKGIYPTSKLGCVSWLWEKHTRLVPHYSQQ